MKSFKIFAILFAFLALPFLSEAQLSGGFGNGIMVTYNGYINGVGALRVASNVGDTHDYTTYPSSNAFYGFSSLTLGWDHGYIGGYFDHSVNVSKATLDAIPVGGTIYQYYGSTIFYYQITKGPGYSVPGATYDYSLSIKVYDPSL